MKSYQHPHIALTVDDIDATKNFYTSLGFAIAEDMYSEDKKRHFLLLQGFGLEIEVFHFDDQARNQRLQAENLEEVGIKHIALPVENIQGFRDELMGKNIPLIKDTSISSLGVKNINVIDPSGLVIEFFERFK